MIQPSIRLRIHSVQPLIWALSSPRPGCGRIPTAILQTRSISKAYLDKKEGAQRAWEKQEIEIREGRQESMLTTLEKRGYINAIAGERDDLDELMIKKRIGIYAGFDPTASSLHVGHLLPLMVVFWFYVKGFSATTLLGTATAGIGDPIGRTDSRPTLSSADRKLNTATIHYQLKRLWQLCETHAKGYGYQWEWAWNKALKNNNHWLNKLPMIEVLKLLGPSMRLGTMLGRDTVKTRLDSGVGMSFSEFSYPVMQAWDWWHLYHTNETQIQVGGSDQYGNIIAGMDAINHINKHHHDPHVRIAPHQEALAKPMGFTVPLLTTSSGEKFGKSAGNAVWLDHEQTSCFDLYQYFLRTTDADVERYLKLFTFLPLSDISGLIEEHSEAPHKRVAQHKLAYEVLCLVHGAQNAKVAQEQHNAVFQKPTVTGLLSAASEPTSPPQSSQPKSWGPAVAASGSNTPPKSLPTDVSPSLNIHAPQANASSSPLSNATLPLSLVQDMPIARVLYSAGLVSSRSEGHRLILKRGAYVASRPDKKGGMPDQVDYIPIDNWAPAETMSYMIPTEQDSGPISTLQGNSRATEQDMIGSFIFRIGKWRVRIVRVISDSSFIEKGLSCPGWSPPGANPSSSSSPNTPPLSIRPSKSLGKVPPAPKPDPSILESQRQEQSVRDAEITFARKRREGWLGETIPVKPSQSPRTPEARREERLQKKRARQEALTEIQDRRVLKRERERPEKMEARDRRREDRRTAGVRAMEKRVDREEGMEEGDEDERDEPRRRVKWEEKLRARDQGRVDWKGRGKVARPRRGRTAARPSVGVRGRGRSIG